MSSVMYLDNYIVKTPLQPKTQEEYRIYLKKNLEVEDYEDVLLAIMDLDYYDNIDDELQGIVSAYFSLEG